MRYEVQLAGETHDVQVNELSGHVYEVRVDDREPVRVDAYRTPRTVYSILIEARQYEGSVDVRDDGSFDVHVGASAFDCTVIDERLKMLSVAAGATPTGVQELRAQMPGKIVKLLAREGQSVREGESLVIVEAMKMENELKSPISGTVTKVAVGEGDSVENDELLVVVEPPDEG